MEVYIGFDISLQTTHVCVVDSEGKTMKEGVASSEVDALATWLRTQCSDWMIKRIVFETGQLSTYFYHSLKALGFPVICIDARHAHGTLKAQRIKTDKNDARGLAQIARTGWYKPIHVKSDASQALRTLVAGRKQLVEARHVLELHMRGTLKTFGIKLGTVTCPGFAAKVKILIEREDGLVKGTFHALLKAREEMLAQEKSLDKQCKALAKADAVCKQLMTIPGVGAITALAFKSEIDDPRRFTTSRDVGVHVGLTPRKYASGEVDRNGGVSKCGNRCLRALLYEASVTMLTRSQKWSRLKAWGVKLAQRSSFKVACTAVARKLAIVMHRMWIDNTNFAYGEAPAALAAA
jgi:transposase